MQATKVKYLDGGHYCRQAQHSTYQGRGKDFIVRKNLQQLGVAGDEKTSDEV